VSYRPPFVQPRRARIIPAGTTVLQITTAGTRRPPATNSDTQPAARQPIVLLVRARRFWPWPRTAAPPLRAHAARRPCAATFGRF
jgi:hypothetical protein